MPSSFIGSAINWIKAVGPKWILLGFWIPSKRSNPRFACCMRFRVVSLFSNSIKKVVMNVNFNCLKNLQNCILNLKTTSHREGRLKADKFVGIKMLQGFSMKFLCTRITGLTSSRKVCKSFHYFCLLLVLEFVFLLITTFWGHSRWLAGFTSGSIIWLKVH